MTRHYSYSRHEPRLAELARPKPVPFGYRDDRKSVYWIESRPVAPGAAGTTEFAGTPRLAELSTPKSSRTEVLDSNFRENPIWPVSDAAKSYSATARVSSLAEPVHVHPRYQYERPLGQPVSAGARSSRPSTRVEALSAPVPFKTWGASKDTVRDEDFTVPIRPVVERAKYAESSPRTELLARHKTHSTINVVPFMDFYSPIERSYTFTSNVIV